MNNILNYINWRGDLSFAAAPFNDVDNLIFSQLVYVDFSAVMAEYDSNVLFLCDAQKKMAELYPDGFMPKGLMQKEPLNELLRLAGESERFGHVGIFMPHSRFDEQNVEQFFAATFILGDGNMYVGFRGTDQSVVGWQEDFNMACICPVPSQYDAVAYLELVAGLRSEGIITGGHSKGGNLAIYSAAFSRDIFDRIVGIYSDDGPGFPDDIIESAEYNAVLPKIKTIVPQGSVIGMLLGHKEEYAVVKSTQKGISQHDGFSWEVMGAGFVTLESRNKGSLIVDDTLSKWISSLSGDERKVFVASLFEILTASGIQSLDEIPSDALKLLKSLRVIPPQTKEVLGSALKRLKNQALETAKAFMPSVPRLENTAQKEQHNQ